MATHPRPMHKASVPTLIDASRAARARRVLPAGKGEDIHGGAARAQGCPAGDGAAPGFGWGSRGIERGV
jgi:hypothetical protein